MVFLAKFFIIIAFYFFNGYFVKCTQPIEFIVDDDLGFFLKSSKNSFPKDSNSQHNNLTLLSNKKYFLIRDTNNLIVNAKYLTAETFNDNEIETTNHDNEQTYLKTTNSIINSNNKNLLKIDPKINAYLIDRYYSIIQTFLRVFIIATHKNADLILRQQNTYHTCVTVVAFNFELMQAYTKNSTFNHSNEAFKHNNHHSGYFHRNTGQYYEQHEKTNEKLFNENNFLFQNCLLTSPNLNCLLNLKLNLNNNFMNLNAKILVYYKIDLFASKNECLDSTFDFILNDFLLKKSKYKFLSLAKYMHLNDYNKKYSKQILFTPYLPFNIYIPKSEYRYENKLFINCEFLNDYLSTQRIFEHMSHFNLSIQTNQFIDIKNVTFLIDKNSFDYQFLLKDERNLQINIEKLVITKNSNNNQININNVKSIEFCIEFLITNNKTILENLDDTQQLNALIKWNLEITLPKFLHSRRNYSLNTTLLIQKSNLVKILPIIETNELLNAAVLTSRKHSYPLKIYALFSNHSIIDVTKQCQCTTNSTKFQVKPICSEIYFDGTETLVDQNEEQEQQQLILSQQVQVKYKQKLEYLKLSIYEPELPLLMETTHKILNQIVNWYTYKPMKLKKLLKRATYYDYENDIENDSVADDEYSSELKYPYTMIDKKQINSKQDGSDCLLQYQLAEISVYTKFFTINPHGTKVYFNGLSKNYHDAELFEDSSFDGILDQSFGEELIFDVSDFVKLKIDNLNLASFITKRVIKPNLPGVINVQVISPITNQTYGQLELHISNLKQKLIDMNIIPLNDLKLDLKQINPNQYEFNLHSLIHFNNQTNNNYYLTKVLLNIQLKFNDFTEVPLNYYTKSDYSINITQIKTAHSNEETEPVRVYIDETNLIIKLIFNKTTISNPQKNYKFLLKLFSNSCYKTLLLSKEFEIKFSNIDSVKFNQTLVLRNPISATKSLIALPPGTTAHSMTTTTSPHKQPITTTATTTSTTTSNVKTLQQNSTLLTTYFINYKVIHLNSNDINFNDSPNDKMTNINLNSLIKKSKEKLLNYSIFKVILYALISLFTLILIIFFVNLLIIHYKNKKQKFQQRCLQSQGDGSQTTNQKTFNHSTISNWQFEFSNKSNQHLLTPSQQHQLVNNQPQQCVYLNQYRQQSILSDSNHERNLNYFQPTILSNYQLNKVNDKSDSLRTTTATNEFDFIIPNRSLKEQKRKCMKTSSRKSGDFSLLSHRKSLFFPKKNLSKSQSFKQVKDWVWLGKDGIEYINENQMNNLSHNCSLINSSLPKTIINGYLNRWSTPNHQILTLKSSSTASSSTQVNSIIFSNTCNNTNNNTNGNNINRNTNTNKSNSRSTITTLNNFNSDDLTYKDSLNTATAEDGVYEDMANYFENLKESRA